MVWPYGEYNTIALEAAARSGMPLTMGLGDGDNTLADISAMKRLIVTNNADVDQFARLIKEQRIGQALVVAHIDMDYLYDESLEQTSRNINALVQRIQSSCVNTVFLQAFSDPDSDGIAEQLYFPNRHLPVRRDLFNHVALLLRSQAEVKVYAWLPIMAYKANLPDEWYVKQWHKGIPKISKNWHLSPFNASARQFVGDIFEDLARYSDFNGILFHDDGILSDFEDVSTPTMTYTYGVRGLPAEFETIHASTELRMQWAQHKTELIGQFTDRITSRVKFYRPYIKTVRNLYAQPLLNKNSHEWYAQSFDAFMEHYDYIAV